MYRLVASVLCVFCMGCSSDPNDVTLMGIDSNNDGIRDDVYTHIVELNLDTNETLALVNYARHYQSRFLLDMTDSSAVFEYLEGLSQEMACIFDAFGIDKVMEITKTTDGISGLISNTAQRKDVTTQLIKAHPAVLHNRSNKDNCP